MIEDLRIDDGQSLGGVQAHRLLVSHLGPLSYNINYDIIKQPPLAVKLNPTLIVV